mmetsp:Transcript_23970/g.42908  ORF Transcript_23970/g.42908 Transcript_23970/m.42908 type:complete len:333 (+) Transcript_23970:231-1229(+)
MDNSDDLFGGLPAVLKTENGGVVDTITSTATNNIVDNSNVVTSKSNPAAAGGEKVPEKRKAGASLVSSLGTAGTAMAFVPHAIRKKKKISQQPQSQQLQISIKKNVVTEKVISHNGSQINYIDPNKSASSAPQQISVPTSETKSDHATHHEASNNDNDNQSTDNPHYSDSATNNNNEPNLENEPESLRLLHASVTNPYDPHFPNDYLAYRERKKTEQARKELQRSALQRLDQQEKLRKKIEEERKKMLQSGELNKFVESHGGGDHQAAYAVAVAGGAVVMGASVGRGRGRGRGVANLPAWLVRQQQQEQKDAEAKISDTKPYDGQFDDSAQS